MPGSTPGRTSTWPSNGGGMTWQPITYDPDLNLIYVTTGQSAAGGRLQEPARRESLHRVDRRAQRRHRQDGLVLPVVAERHARLGRHAERRGLFDAPINGQPRKLIAQASRNGWFFVLDRTNGKAIVSTEYIKTNWALGHDDTGSPIPNPAKRPQIAGALVTPNQGGATNWYPPSFSPQTGLFYVNANRAFSVWYIYDASDNPMGWGGTDRGGYAEQATAQGDRLSHRPDQMEHPALRRQLRSPLDGRQRALWIGRGRHRRLQRHDRRAALECAARRVGQQWSDHVRAGRSRSTSSRPQAAGSSRSC